MAPASSPTIFSRFFRIHIIVGLLAVALVSVVGGIADYASIRHFLIEDFKHAVDHATADYELLYEHKELSQLENYLQVFSKHPGMVRLCAYDTENKNIASWQKSGKCPEFLIKTGVDANVFIVHITQTVEHNGKYLGIIYAEGELITLEQWLARDIFFVIGLLLIAGVASFAAAHMGARHITQPLKAIRQQIECLKENDVAFCPLHVNAPTAEILELTNSVADLRRHLAATTVTRAYLANLRNWHWDILSVMLATMRHRLSADSLLLNNLSDYALLLQADRGDALPPPQPFNLADILNASVKLARALEPSDGNVNVIASLQSHMPKEWQGHKDIIEAIIRHLLLIGFKRVRQGFICLRIEAVAYKNYEALSEHSHQLRFAFEDSGATIQQGQLNLLLSLAHDEIPPSGIGNDISWLLISRLFKRLSGSLTGRSGTDGGLVLEGCLPLSIYIPETTALIPAKSSTLSRMHSKPPLLLVVENNPEIRKTLERQFTEAGCQIFVVQTHAQVVTMAPILPLSAIILNTAMIDTGEDITHHLEHMAQEGVMPQVPLWGTISTLSFIEFDHWQQKGIKELLLMPLQLTALKQLCHCLAPLDSHFYQVYNESLRNDLPPSLAQSMSEMNRLLAVQLAQVLPIVETLAQGEIPENTADQTHAVKSAALTLGYFRLAALMGEIEYFATMPQAGLLPQNWKIIAHIIRDIRL